MSRKDIELPHAVQDEVLKVRAAWLYYVEGRTQERISDEFGVSRLKIHRLLSAARDEGIVQFRISNKIADCISLEQTLREKYGLSEVVVVPRSIEPALTHAMVAQATSALLANNIHEGMTIGLGWGRTLHHAIRHLPQRATNGNTIVSLLGGLTRTRPLNPTECAWELAEKLEADCYMLPIPVYTDDPELRDRLLQQKSVLDVVNRARRADLAVVSVGSLAADSPIASYGFIAAHEFEELREAGATGDLLCNFLGEDGKIVDHPVNHRVCSFPIRDLSRIPKIIMASGGREKISVLRSALMLTRATVLVTDETAATGLMRYTT